MRLSHFLVIVSVCLTGCTLPLVEVDNQPVTTLILADATESFVFQKEGHLVLNLALKGLRVRPGLMAVIRVDSSPRLVWYGEPASITSDELEQIHRQLSDLDTLATDYPAAFELACDWVRQNSPGGGEVIVIVIGDLLSQGRQVKPTLEFDFSKLTLLGDKVKLGFFLPSFEESRKMRQSQSILDRAAWYCCERAFVRPAVGEGINFDDWPTLGLDERSVAK